MVCRWRGGRSASPACAIPPVRVRDSATAQESHTLYMRDTNRGPGGVARRPVQRVRLPLGADRERSEAMMQEAFYVTGDGIRIRYLSVGDRKSTRLNSSHVSES